MSNTMKAMTYYGENDIRFEDRPIPTVIDPTDAVVKLVKTTICGTDLGIWKGKNPEIEETEIAKTGSWNGRILGHEGVGIVEEVGSAVKKFKKGDKVLISCVNSCRNCKNCKVELYAHCENEGGWIMGYMVDGTHAEYVRTKFADTSLYAIPENVSDEEAVFLSDILPTGHEIGVQYGEVKVGDTVVIVGAGPVGMSVLLTSKLYSPAKIIVVDMDDNRLEMAREMGATDTINSGKQDAVAEILALTEDGKGVDVAIEAVGIPATWDICQKVVKPGGHLANVGVHGKPVEFDIQKLWIKNLTITTGLVNTNTTETLLKACNSGQLAVDKLATHRFKFSEMEKAYDVFKHAAEEKALKVIIDFE